jgi:dipeptidyl aminopeptidase/acylaminoacyl peptidase
VSSCKHVVLLAVVLGLLGFPGSIQAGGLTPELLWNLTRLGDPQPSPDGSTIVYVARNYDVDSNGSTANLWVVPAGGGESRRLTSAAVHDGSPRWLPGSNIILFTSDRDESSALWALDSKGGEPWQISDLPLDMGGFILAGDKVVFTLDVAPDCADLDCTLEKIETDAAAPARVYTELLFRHWDTWEDGLRSHLFVADLKMNKRGRPVGLGEPVDLMKGIDADSPTHPFGGMEEVAVSPDGKDVVFAAKVLAGSEAAWSTDVDLFRVALDGSGTPEKVTTANRAWDTSPTWSTDGRWLAYTAMDRPGFEADRFHIVLRARGEDGSLGSPQTVAGDWDRSVSSLTWSQDGKSLIVTAQETGRLKIFSVSVPGGKVTPLVEDHHNTSVQVAGDGRIIFMQDSATAPADIYILGKSGQPEQLTWVNASLLAGVEMNPAEDFWFEGAGGEQVHGWLVRPVASGRGKLPVAFVIHGGPQGANSDQFHYRWNPQIYAGAGYLTLAINFHGSTGYGQAFTDSITGDWGGAPYEDLMKGLDHLLATDKTADGERMCALGASYGGYMVNWVAGHTDRFNCLINHDGLFDLRSMYFSTEELWFPEWEMGGPAWESPEEYRRFSPSQFVENWSTPMLVIHGGRDYRVPETEGFATFTALRRRGIEARLLYYPGENHWVLRPQGAQVWHQEVLGWMERWTGN